MKRMTKRALLLATVAAGALLAAMGTAAAAEAFPQRPIRLILGFAPGGPVDLSARIAAEALSRQLGQPVTVENRAGAGGAIASKLVAAAPADGYTLLVNATSDIINPILDKTIGYKLEQDFTPVGLIASAPNVLVVHPSLPVHSVPELVAFAKAHPKAISYGSAGIGTVSHLAGILLSSMSGAPMTHVPYKGTGAAQADFLAGRVPVMFDGLLTGLANAKAGKARALAVTWPQRWPGAPDVPSMAESGYPGYSLLAIFGLMAPAGTPQAVVDRLSHALLEGLRSDTARKRIALIGAEPGRMTPAEYRQYLATESARWAKLLREAQVAR